jgi:prevent-host-death family protein
VSATDFQNNVGVYFDRAGKEPVVITKHARPARVLLDFEEYERLKQLDTREALYPLELSAEEIEELRRAKMDPRHELLDKLMG